MTSEAAVFLVMRLMEEELIGLRLKEHTRRMIRADQDMFLRFLDGRDMREAGKAELIRYHEHLCTLVSKRSGELLSVNTIHDRFYNACRLFSVMYRSGLIKENPAQGLELDIPRRSGMIRRPLTRDEITRFLESLDTTAELGLRDRTLFELIYSSGLRVAEAVGLKLSDINLDRREIIVRGKGERERLVPVSRLSAAFLELYLGRRPKGEDGWVFPGGSRGRRPGVACALGL
ncbi:tyrosine-type recombinase/integrase [Brucepastera parasyntrophica]|uniref:tyrosine-type recombinase/integrase n=1 Tax=Brucepastera parasyntrophica TaxID=2880008 RepID=UPI002109BD74|nr:tyrosine-type recombinase/integrase [Brucepastera parasyntrophica]